MNIEKRGINAIMTQEIIDNALSYRVGYVTKQNMTIYACCRLVPKEDVLFKYVEVKYKDGMSKFFFEDEEGYEHFERNFISKRFTSYHEFFTTDEAAIERRGSLELKYYVRRTNDSYQKTDITHLLSELEMHEKAKKLSRLEDRITEYGHYEIEPNKH